MMILNTLRMDTGSNVTYVDDIRHILLASSGGLSDPELAEERRPQSRRRPNIKEAVQSKR